MQRPALRKDVHGRGWEPRRKGSKNHRGQRELVLDTLVSSPWNSVFLLAKQSLALANGLRLEEEEEEDANSFLWG